MSVQLAELNINTYRCELCVLMPLDSRMTTGHHIVVNHVMRPV